MKQCVAGNQLPRPCESVLFSPAPLNKLKYIYVCMVLTFLHQGTNMTKGEKCMGRRWQYGWSGMWHFHAEITSHFKPGNLHSEMGMWEMACPLSPMMSALLLYVTQRPLGMLYHSAGSLPTVVKSARCKKQAGVCLWPRIYSNWHFWLLHHCGVIYRTQMFLTQCSFLKKLHITWVHTENTIAPKKDQLSLASLPCIDTKASAGAIMILGTIMAQSKSRIKLKLFENFKETETLLLSFCLFLHQ